MGVVLGFCLFGMIDFRIFAWRFGSFFVFSSCSVRDCFLSLFYHFVEFISVCVVFFDILLCGVLYFHFM